MNRQKLKELKLDFVSQCITKERKKLSKKADEHLHGSFWSIFNTRNWPDEDDVLRARKRHTCLNSSCKKKIKKGQFYFRRSFGQLWTIKACSIECFCRLLP